MTLKFSVIIPTYNEQKKIAETISHVRSTSNLSPTEIIVVDGRSGDGTLEIAKRWADKTLPAQQQGRAAQMQQGASVATGDVLVFLHGDTRLPLNWQNSLHNIWESAKRPSHTAFRLGFNQEGWRYRWMETLAMWRCELIGVAHGDQAIAIQKSLFDQVGGFPTVPLMEEYYLARKLKPHGRLKILEERVATSARRYKRNGAFFNALRNNLIIFLFYLGVPSAQLAKLYGFIPFWRKPSSMPVTMGNVGSDAHSQIDPS